MRRAHTVSRSLLLVIVLGSFLVAFGAGTTTYGLLTDSENATGTVQAADSFSFPKDADAYDDENGDNTWNPGETTYSQTDLTGFVDSTVDLHFHKDADKISSNLDVEVSTITIDDKLSVQGVDSLYLKAVDGSIDFSNADVKNGPTTVRINSTDADVDLSDSTFQKINELYVRALNGNIIVTQKTKCQNVGTIDMQDQNGNVSC